MSRYGWASVRRLVAHFVKNSRGNVAITFAILTVPLLATVGFAVDYSRANAVKVSLQSALDTVALMISKEAATDTSSQLQTNAQNYFMALFADPQAKYGAQNVTVTASYTTGGTALQINACSDVPTTIIGIVGFNTLTVCNATTSKWGMTRLRVALVLDNTGSMAQSSKMPALQAATNSLLTQLQNAVTTNGDVYVSIVPFVKDSNLGTANYASNYIYWGTIAQDPTLSDNNSWDANNGTCTLLGSTLNNVNTRSSCLTHAACSISGFTSQAGCTGAGTCSLTSYTIQSTCEAAGACSLSGNNNQTACTGAGTCSISGSAHNTQSTCTTATCSLSGYTSPNSCTGAGTCSNPGETNQSSCTGNKACTKSQYTSKSPCQSNGGTWGFGNWTPGVWTAAGTWTPGTWTAATWTPGVWAVATWTPDNHNTWHGCVMDRGGSSGPDPSNYDTNVASPDVTINGSLYAAEQYGSCPQAVMGLNYNWTSMNSLVNAMSPAGNTNQAIGLQLGWLSLVGGGPFTVPAINSNYNYTQAIILLTDGLNTQDRWYSAQGSIDARQQLTCNNINAAGITLYTIQVNTGGDPTSTLLQNCAGSPGHYPDSGKFFLLTSASQILTVFTQIGTELSQLRLAN
jgi:Flp pilus assembly protein TadG